MPVNPASHQDNKNIYNPQNNNPVLKDELKIRFTNLINYMALQNQNTIPNSDEIYLALTDIHNRAKAGQLVLSDDTDTLHYIVCKNLDMLAKERNTQRGTTAGITDHQPGGCKDASLEQPIANATPFNTCSENQPEPHPDQKYITALLTDNTKLVREIYKNFTPLIRQMVLRNSGTLSEVDDLIQDALIAIFEKAKANNIVLTTKFECYFYRICKNQWLSKLKNKKNFKEVNIDLSEEIGESPMDIVNEAALQQQRWELFWEKFFELAKHCQDLLSSRWAGKSTKEVARTLDLTHAGCRTKQAKIIKRLMSLIMHSPKFVSLLR